MLPQILVKIWGDLPLRHLGDVAALLGVDGQHLIHSAARHEPAIAMLETGDALRGKRLAEELDLYRVGFRICEPLSPVHDICAVYARRAITETEETLVARHVVWFFKDSGNDEPDDGPLVPVQVLGCLIAELESVLLAQGDRRETLIDGLADRWRHTMGRAQLPEEGALRLRD